MSADLLNKNIGQSEVKLTVDNPVSLFRLTIVLRVCRWDIDSLCSIALRCDVDTG